MIDKMSVIGIILARGGSKRLPGKNTRLFCNKPLIGWTIEAAKRSKFIDRVIVSTDSEEIGDVARKFGAEVPFLRPRRLATDTATSEEAMTHVLKWLKNDLREDYDYFVHLQSTSPLRNSEHIDNALTLFNKNDFAETLISVANIDKNPYWIQKINKRGFIENFFGDSHKFIIPDEQLYVPNGAICIGRVETFLRSRKIYTKKTISYIMDKESSIDIDDLFDFKCAEFLARNA
jgi:CMP-N,N'-diacetyllegionaminic acid synthase